MYLLQTDLGFFSKPWFHDYFILGFTDFTQDISQNTQYIHNKATFYFGKIKQMSNRGFIIRYFLWFCDLVGTSSARDKYYWNACENGDFPFEHELQSGLQTFDRRKVFDIIPSFLDYSSIRSLCTLPELYMCYFSQDISQKLWILFLFSRYSKCSYPFF